MFLMPGCGAGRISLRGRRQPGMYGNYFLRIRENDWKIERLLCYNQKDVMKRVRGAYLLWVLVLVLQTKHLVLSGEVSDDDDG